jgi:signal peptidase II
VVLATDLVTKHLVVAGHWRAEYLWGLLRIVRVDNPGAAFGLFAGARGIFVAIKLAALVVILALLGRGQESRLTLPLALVFGGALGNLIDRLRGSGEVIDFIDFTVAGRHWYVFNVADASISIGAVLIVLSLLRSERRGARPDALPPGGA